MKFTLKGNYLWPVKLSHSQQFYSTLCIYYYCLNSLINIKHIQNSYIAYTYKIMQSLDNRNCRSGPVLLSRQDIWLQSVHRNEI